MKPSTLHESLDRAYVIFLNGPPQVGKDTIADMLQMYLNENLVHGYAVCRKFAAPLKAAAAAMFQLDPDAALYYFETAQGKSETPVIFHGRTARETLISLSEVWAKPLFGPRIFGQLFVDWMMWELETQLAPGAPTVFIASDSGFQEEYDAVLACVHPRNTWLIRCERPGQDFSGDSREWVMPHDEANADVIHNGGSFDDLGARVAFLGARILDAVAQKNASF